MLTVITRRAFAYLACWLAVLPVAFAADVSVSVPADVHCGPRCISFLLDYFKLPNDGVLSIIDELDVMDKAPGTTMGQLSQVLESNGLVVRGYTLPENEMIEASGPVVIRLKPHGTSQSLGHFCIVLPDSTSTKSRVWVGLEGVQEGSPMELRQQMSHAVLVVSKPDVPVQAGSRRLSATRMYLSTHFEWWRLGLPGVVAILIAFFMSRPRRVPRAGEL